MLLVKQDEEGNDEPDREEEQPDREARADRPEIGEERGGVLADPRVHLLGVDAELFA